MSSYFFLSGRRYLEVGLIINKGSVERAKRQLDRMCTIRTLVPAFFGDYNPKSDFGNLYDIAYVPNYILFFGMLGIMFENNHIFNLYC